MGMMEMPIRMTMVTSQIRGTALGVGGRGLVFMVAAGTLAP